MASMLTGAFSPSGARNAGHEAIAEASEAQEARIARFSASVGSGCETTSLGCSKTVPGCSSAWKSKTLSWVAVVGRMFSSILDEYERQPDTTRPGRTICSSHLGFELMDVAAVNGDLPWLHGCGNFPNQFDLQQPVIERSVLDLDVVRQVELPLEVPGRDTAVQELALCLFRLVAFDRHDVLLGPDRDFVGREAGHRERDLVAVFAKPFDVVGRIVVLAGVLGSRLGKIEKAVEADGRTPEGCKIVSAHSQILHGASWIRAAPDTTGARLCFPGPIWRPVHPAVATGKL